MSSNLPPGVRTNDIPGCGPEDEEYQNLCDSIAGTVESFAKDSLHLSNKDIIEALETIAEEIKNGGLDLKWEAQDKERIMILKGVTIPQLEDQVKNAKNPEERERMSEYLEQERKKLSELKQKYNK